MQGVAFDRAQRFDIFDVIMGGVSLNTGRRLSEDEGSITVNGYGADISMPCVPNVPCPPCEQTRLAQRRRARAWWVSGGGARAAPAQAAALQEELGAEKAQRALAERAAAEAAARDVRCREQAQKATRERRAMLALLRRVQGNVKVVCRLKPLPRPPAVASLVGGGRWSGAAVEAAMAAAAAGGAAALEVGGAGEVTLAGGGGGRWEFDRAFDGGAGQAAVCDELQGVATDALDGFNVCVMAYGATGAGKTHTSTAMQRSAVTALLAGGATHVAVSFYENCGEKLTDLLDAPSDPPKTAELLAVREGSTGELVVCGLREVEVADAGAACELLERANAARATAPTASNARSQQHAMLCCAVLCYAMRCDAMRCDAMRCDAMRCDAMRCDAMRCDAMRRARRARTRCASSGRATQPRARQPARRASPRRRCCWSTSRARSG